MNYNTDKIWNRACDGGGKSPRAGDKALVALLLFHGYAMNGGVLHAVECLTLEQLEKAKCGYRFFGFETIPDLIRRAQNAINNKLNLGAFEVMLDDQYSKLIPNDNVLTNSFERHQEQYPEEYSPIID